MLPKIKAPIFDVEIPSKKKMVKVRPFEVKEERILLMARQGGEAADFFSAMSQITQNCVLDEGVDVMKLPLFDVEYLFARIRAVSVSDISKVQYQDQEDGKTYSFDIDLNKLEVKFPDDVSPEFKVNQEISFTLKYPPMSVYTSKEFFDLDEDGMFNKLLAVCLDKVFVGDVVHDAAEYKPEEIVAFIDQLPAKFYTDIRKFFTNLPSLYNELTYTNANGKEQKIVQRTVEDFFTF